VLSDLAAGLPGVERGYTGGGEVAQVAGHHGELLLQGGGGLLIVAWRYRARCQKEAQQWRSPDGPPRTKSGSKEFVGKPSRSAGFLRVEDNREPLRTC
jgi:hypothetical protein